MMAYLGFSEDAKTTTCEWWRIFAAFPVGCEVHVRAFTDVLVYTFLTQVQAVACFRSRSLSRTIVRNSRSRAFASRQQLVAKVGDSLAKMAPPRLRGNKPKSERFESPFGAWRWCSHQHPQSEITSPGSRKRAGCSGAGTAFCRRPRRRVAQASELWANAKALQPVASH